MTTLTPARHDTPGAAVCGRCGWNHPGRCPLAEPTTRPRPSRLDAHRWARRTRRGGAA